MPKGYAKVKKLAPERRLKRRKSGVASSAPAPNVFALMPKATVRKGFWDGSFFARGAGATRMSPPSMLEELLVGLCDSSVERRLGFAGRARASCEGAPGFEDIGCCAGTVALRNIGSNIRRAARFSSNTGTLFRLAATT
jgi:hypothetical protein